MFITFEGMDGSGKTTQVGLVTEYLKNNGYNVLLTREPGGTATGDVIRELILGKESSGLNARAELLLFNASRAQLVDQVIRPHLAKGGVIICDRYIDSTIAYQGYGHGLDLEYVIKTVMFAVDGLLPDVTFYLDITPEAGLKRRADASLFGEEWNRLDGMALDFHRRVYQGYTDIGGDPANAGRWARIDALQTPEKIHKQIVAQIVGALKKRLPKPGKQK